jgi:hypothetical protein
MLPTASVSWSASNTPTKEKSQAPDAAAFTVTLRPLPGCDGVRALRALLKRALRTYGLKCTDIRGGES